MSGWSGQRSKKRGRHRVFEEDFGCKGYPAALQFSARFKLQRALELGLDLLPLLVRRPLSRDL